MIFHTNTADLKKCCFELSEVIAVEEVNGADCKIHLKGGGSIVINIDYKIIVNVLGSKMDKKDY